MADFQPLPVTLTEESSIKLAEHIAHQLGQVGTSTEEAVLLADEAANLLRMNPQRLKEEAAAGRIPGAFKSGEDSRAWKFIKSGLFEWAWQQSKRFGNGKTKR